MTDLYLDRYIQVSTINLIKELCEDAFERSGEKRTFYLALDKKYKGIKSKIRKEEKYDTKFPNKLDYVCRLKKKHY